MRRIFPLGRDKDSSNARGNLLSPRVKRIKELSTQKEILNDLTAAEFALTLDMSSKDEEQYQESKIDFEKLIHRLDRCISVLKKNPSTNGLNERVLKTKSDLVEAFEKLKANRLEITSHSNNTSTSKSSSALKAFRLNSSAEKTEVTAATPQSSKEKVGLFVREDGTIDWDGAIASGKEVAKFGAELLERLNGKEEQEGLPSLADLFGQVQERAPENEETLRLSLRVDQAKAELTAINEQLASIKLRLREAKKEAMEVTKEDLQMLRILSSKKRDGEQKVLLYTLDLDMERICLFLQTELESTIVPNDQRLFVAEVALIDKQLSALFSNLKLPSRDKADSDDDLVSLVDADELTLIANQVSYLKSRLGLDAAATREVDWGTVGKFVKENLAKLKYILNKLLYL